VSIGDVAASLDQIREELLWQWDRLRATVEYLTGLIRFLFGQLGQPGHPLLESVRGANEALLRVVGAAQQLAPAAEAVGEYRAAITLDGSNGTGPETPSKDVSAAGDGSMPSWISDAAIGLAEGGVRRLGSPRGAGCSPLLRADLQRQGHRTHL
jgi:hypothetical protein